MFRRRSLLAITTSLLLTLYAGAGQAYELTRADYQAMGLMLPAWDNEGRLPEGDTRLYELEHIREQTQERQHRLEVSAYMLQLMESQARDPAVYKSMREDYECQQQSFKRWLESAERRREAILKSTSTVAADGGKKASRRYSLASSNYH